MRLLLDIGNSRIKWAYAADEKLSAAGEIEHRNKLPANAASFVKTLEIIPDQIFAINVAGAAIGQALATEFMQKWQRELTFVETSDQAGQVRNGYDENSVKQLGADRWSALVAAWNLKRAAVCVVDAGSALTLDLVAADGQHLGGIIMPGIHMMRSALLTDTSDIANFAAQSQQHSASSGNTEVWYGTDTASGITRGSLFAATSVIRNALTQFPATTAKPHVMITGGDAEELIKELDRDVEHRPMLVLEGLNFLADLG